MTGARRTRDEKPHLEHDPNSRRNLTATLITVGGAMGGTLLIALFFLSGTFDQLMTGTLRLYLPEDWNVVASGESELRDGAHIVTNTVPARGGHKTAGAGSGGGASHASRLIEQEYPKLSIVLDHIVAAAKGLPFQQRIALSQ